MRFKSLFKRIEKKRVENLSHFSPLFPSSLLNKLFLLLCIAILLLMPPLEKSVLAQSTVLALYDTVTGSVAAGGSEDWTLSAPAGAVLSLFVRAQDGALDPTLALLEGGTVLLANDDYAYPDTRDAGLQAITIPRTGTYTVRVSAFGSSAGAYILSVMPGYGQEALRDTFDSGGTWAASGAGDVAAGDGTLLINVDGIEQVGSASSASMPTFEQFYAQADIREVRGRGGWVVAMNARESGTQSYVFEVNQLGQTRFVRRSGEQITTLRDWSTHPAIRAGETEFTLGILAYNQDFDLFYNSVLIGSVRDGEPARAGRFSFAARTGSALDAAVEFQVDTLLVTTPVSPEIFPEQLLVVNDAAAMSQELERRGLTPPAEIGLNISESFIESARAGVSTLRLASSETFSTFAIGAFVSWQAGFLEAPVGCGLMTQYENEDNYTVAYLAQGGVYGVSARAEDVFTEGIYGILAPPPQPPHHLLVVVQADRQHYFIDGRYVGSQATDAAAGGIGVAVINYEPANTNCQYTNLWLAEFTN
jgi:hypothetical protein